MKRKTQARPKPQEVNLAWKRLCALVKQYQRELRHDFIPVPRVLAEFAEVMCLPAGCLARTRIGRLNSRTRGPRADVREQMIRALVVSGTWSIDRIAFEFGLSKDRVRKISNGLAKKRRRINAHTSDSPQVAEQK